MAAHTSAASHTDSTYSISATLPATYDATGYGTTTGIAWTLIGRMESFPAYGSVRTVAEFRPIAGSVEKIKGAPDYGGGEAVMADMPADAGQVILKAAAASPNHYSMKVTLPDGEVHYLDIMNMSWSLSQAVEAAFLKRTADIQVQKEPVVVAAP